MNSSNSHYLLGCIAQNRLLCCAMDPEIDASKLAAVLFLIKILSANISKYGILMDLITLFGCKTLKMLDNASCQLKLVLWS